MWEVVWLTRKIFWSNSEWLFWLSWFCCTLLKRRRRWHRHFQCRHQRSVCLYRFLQKDLSCVISVRFSCGRSLKSSMFFSFHPRVSSCCYLIRYVLVQFVLVLFNLVCIHVRTRTVYFSDSIWPICLFRSNHKLLICDYLWPFCVHDFPEEVQVA